ncbi:hypothetical protein KAR91_61820 [Candidatus Pacearchaeota archaeon]|nr:hypothetical protein [Candidatus Pacearchaeota archaeon]
MKNRTKFNWKCGYCGKRNIEAWRFQFDVPKCYTVEVTCQKCGKISIIEFRLTVETVTSVVSK